MIVDHPEQGRSTNITLHCCLSRFRPRQDLHLYGVLRMYSVLSPLQGGTHSGMSHYPLFHTAYRVCTRMSSRGEHARPNITPQVGRKTASPQPSINAATISIPGSKQPGTSASPPAHQLHSSTSAFQTLPYLIDSPIPLLLLSIMNPPTSMHACMPACASS